MTIPPEQKREIDNAITKFLQHLATESRERLDRVDVVDVKNFDLNFCLNMHPQQASITTR